MKNKTAKIAYCIFTVLLFFAGYSSAQEKVKDASYYYHNIDEATKLLEGKCKSYAIGAEGDGILGNDKECLVVRDVVRQNVKIREHNLLIDSLRKMESVTSVSVKVETPDEKLRYREFARNFEENSPAAEEFLVSCIENKERVKTNGIECLAAIRTMIAHTESEKQADMPEYAKADEYREYYRKYFRENNELDDKCKNLFANPWYDKDPEIQDVKCNIALAEKKRKQRMLRTTEIEEEKGQNVKDLTYFRKNLKEAQALKDVCIEGTITNINHCNYALQAVEENELEKLSAAKHQEFYSKHPLAAKFRMRWCKSAMIDFNTECKIIADVLKNHKDKELDEKKYQLYYAFFKDKPQEIKQVLDGECKTKLEDSWYFLDINLQTEKCNAALDIISQ